MTFPKSVSLVLLSASVLLARENPAPSQPTSRSKVLELAGAFSNDGYKTRDGFWSGTLEPGKPQFLEVNLYAGNQYWFSLAALPPARKVSVMLFDETGAAVESQLFQDAATAAAGITPSASGRYFVRVEMPEGEKSEFCLVYSYK